MSGLALVTGAAGFIGSHVVRQLLEDRFEVVGIGHAAADPYVGPAFQMQESDIDLPALHALRCVPDIVIHCAGSASVGRSIADPNAERRRTLDSAAAVLNFAVATAPRAHLVLISSAAVYGNAAVQPIQESAVLSPISPYGDYKLQAEEMWRFHAGRHGLAGTIVRLFSVYGEGLRKQLLWDACNKLSAGNNEFGGTGEESRDWLHVADAARLLVLAGRYAAPNCPVVNGGFGRAVTVREVLSDLSFALGLDLTPRFNGIARPGDPVRYLADNARARAWGWRPQVEWHEGIRRYAHWFRNETH